MKAKTPIDLDRVRELAQLGLSTEQIGAALGLTGRTVRRRRREDDAFAAAFDAGRAAAIEQHARLLEEHARGGSLKAVCFFLSNVAGWGRQDSALHREADEQNARAKNAERQREDDELDEIMDGRGLLRGIVRDRDGD